MWGCHTYWTSSNPSSSLLLPYTCKGVFCRENRFPRESSSGQGCTSHIVLNTHGKRKSWADANEWKKPSTQKPCDLDHTISFWSNYNTILWLLLVIYRMGILNFPYRDPGIFLKIKNEIKLESALSSQSNKDRY